MTTYTVKHNYASSERPDVGELEVAADSFEPMMGQPRCVVFYDITNGSSNAVAMVNEVVSVTVKAESNTPVSELHKV